MVDADKVIKRALRIKPRDTLPYTGWARSTRRDIYNIFNALGYKKGAEIGVSRGYNAKSLCLRIPGLHLICVDPWTAYNRITAERAESRRRTCLERLKRFDVEYMRMTSMEAVKKVPDASLDFVYIDGMHDFDSVMMDIIHWVPKVRIGGVVSGHDYYDFYQSGIIEAVNAYTRAHNIRDWYVTRIEKQATWLWVNK